MAISWKASLVTGCACVCMCVATPLLHGQTQGVQQSDRTLADARAKGFIRQALASGHAEVELAVIAEGRAEVEAVQDYARTVQQHHRQANERLIALAEDEDIDLPATLTRAVQGGEYQQRANEPVTGSGPQMQPGQQSTPSAPGTNPGSPGEEPVTPQTVAPEEPEEDTQASPTDVSRTLVDTGDEGIGPRNYDAREISKISSGVFVQRYLEIEMENHKAQIARYETMANSQDDNDIRQFARDTMPVLQRHLQMAEGLYREHVPESQRQNKMQRAMP